MLGNDFLSFYAGGKLAFSPSVYDAATIKAVQLDAAGMTDPALRFIRLPYLAALFWPIAQLPFAAACGVWQCLSVGALIAFVCLWRPPGPRNTVLVLALFVPTLTAVLNGQDVNFLLVWIALAFRALHRGSDFEAGLWFSLCLEKYHLFVLVALIVVVRRMWKFGGGAALGASLLLAVGFVTNGWGWPVRYWSVVRDGRIHPYPFRMPTVHALSLGFAWPAWGEWALVALIAGGVWFAARRMAAPTALALAIAAGPLVAWHAYVADCAILLPAGLALFTAIPNRFVRGVVVLALCPPVWQSLGDQYPQASIAPLALLALIATIVLYTVPAREPALTAMSSPAPH